MDEFDRRTALRAIGLGVGGSLAGCLDERPGDGSPGDDTDTPNGSPTPTDGLAYETHPFGQPLERPARHGDDDTTGHVELYASEAAATTALALDALADDRRATAESFVSGTEFATERLLYVVSVGPDTCHSAIEFSDLSVAEDELRADARVVDTSDPNEACGDAITFPAVLVRVSFDEVPPDRAHLALTDGWGEYSELEAVAVARDPAALDGHVRPDGDPSTVPPALECDDPDFRRHGEGFTGRPPWGLTSSGWGAFALRADATTVATGETITITMTNVGAVDGHAGNAAKYNLQVRTEAGWQDVRGNPDGEPMEYTDEAYVHEPGEGVEWALAMTEDGVLAGHMHEGRLSVCPGLPAGRYRFVFWEPTVAVAFDVVADGA